MKTTQLLTVLLSLAVPLAASAADAKANWDEYCAKCHGADGKGQTRMGKKLHIRDFSSAKVQAEFTDEQAVNAMKHGLTNKSGKMTMKVIEQLSAEDMKALVPFVRSLKQ